MKFFPKGTWGYAIMLVVLFSLAAVATKSVVDLAAERLLPGYEQGVREISLAIWLLTMGFMFLAGALGLWGISATAEYESRYRIARIVNTMNHLADGLLALDYQGYVKGANPAARQLASRHIIPGKRILLNAVFPALTAEDLRRLLNRHNPVEIEMESVYSSGVRRLRLRSQPAEGLTLVFISDITEMHSATVQQQQIAKLQLLGRIAGGVAHDFSNILSGISGHAALMQRFGDDKRSLNDSLGIIINETQRGVRLSRQLLALSRSSDLGGQPSDNIAKDVSEAEELLRVALSATWTVTAETRGTFPVAPFSSSQIVQIVLNLGLLAADSFKKPGRLTIHLKQPAGSSADGEDISSQGYDFNRFAAIIVISASAEEDSGGQAAVSPLAPATAMGMVDTTGVIPSVVRSLIEEAGGRLDELYASSLKVIYRVCLPRLSQAGSSDFIPAKRSFRNAPSLAGAGQDLKHLKVVLAGDEHKFKWLEKMLADQGAAIERKAVIDSVLRAVDSDSKPDLVIAEKHIFGAEADSLLKAVRKICPQCGLIIISRRPEEEELYQQKGFVFLMPNSDAETWLDAIVRLRRSLTA